MQTFIDSVLIILQTHLLALAILLPLLFAGIIQLFARNRERISFSLSILAITLSVIFVFIRGLDLIPFSPLSPPNVIEPLLWIPTLNFGLSFMLDGLNFPIIIITAIITVLIILWSRSFFEDKKRTGVFFSTILLMYVGMLGVFAGADLFLFYLFWEITIIPAYILVIFWREVGISKEEARKTGMKFFLWTHVGSLVMLMGLILVFTLTGTTNMLDIPTALASLPSTYIHILQFAAVTLIFGFLVKLGIFPFHSWLPDTYVQASSPATALIGGLLTNIGAYGLIRIVASWFPTIVTQWSFPLGLLAVISIIYGGYLALGQTEFKRRWAYSSISQGGYILLGVASVSLLGLAGSTFHVINSAILKSALFLTAGTYLMVLKTTDVDSLRGIGTKMPFTGITFLVAAFGMAGIPFLNGFISEILIFLGIFSVSSALIVALIGAAAIIITFAYVLGPIYKLFVSSPEKEQAKAKDPKPWQTIPFILLTISILILGIWPNLVLTPIGHWVGTLNLGGP
ncbi:MAG: complex I subunit 5 family protein [Candidatus Thorarchaeota archaeon]